MEGTLRSDSLHTASFLVKAYDRAAVRMGPPDFGVMDPPNPR
jgi:hypothetical protein